MPDLARAAEPPPTHRRALGVVALVLAAVWAAGRLVLPAAAQPLEPPAPPQPSEPRQVLAPLEPPATEPDPEAWELGRDLYAVSCAVCHGTDGRGGARGPSVIGVGAASHYYQLSTGRMPLLDHQDVPRRDDPAFSPEQIDALVRYGASFGGGPELPVVGEGDPVAGRALWVEHCAVCHGSTGSGANKVTDRRAPDMAPVTPTQLAAAVRVGPNLMPVYPETVLSDDDVDDVVAYVAQLEASGDRGGLALDRMGPVGETPVVWLGVGVLLVVIWRLARSAG